MHTCLQDSRTNLLERWMLIIAGVLLVYTSTVSDLIGFGLIAVALAMQLMRRAPAPAASA